MSRADLARKSGLTRVTVSDLVTKLTADGTVEERGPREGTHVGKPATLIDIRTDTFHIIALDLSADDRFVGGVINRLRHLRRHRDDGLPRGTNPYLTSSRDPEVRLFRGPQTQQPAGYPLDGWGYSEVGVVVETVPAGNVNDDDVQVGDTVWGIWGHRAEGVLPATALRGHRLADHLDPVARCFARDGAIALNAVLAADIGVGATVVVGQGVIRLLATRLSVLSGARVLAVDGIDLRLDRARTFGAEEVLQPDPEHAERLREITGSAGADAAIELSGTYAGLGSAIRAVGRRRAGCRRGLLPGLCRRSAARGRVPSQPGAGGRLTDRLRATAYDCPLGPPAAASHRHECDRPWRHRRAPVGHPPLPPRPRARGLPGPRRARRRGPAGRPGDVMALICVQEQHLHGTTLEEKWEAATEWGYTGIELRAKGDLAFEARLPELRRARATVS